MNDMMQFPNTVEEFMENNKIVDTEQIYTNGSELVPIFRMKQWFDHIKRTSSERRGRWLKGDEMADYPRVPYKPWETYCSCCGGIKEQSNDNFCGNCGAKMDVNEMEGEQNG